MRIKSLFKDFYVLIAIAVSIVLCLGLIFALWQKNETTEGFSNILNSHILVFISISGALSAILLFFLVKFSLGLKTNKIKAIGQLGKLTQKMHNFRTIADLLLKSNIWLPGLKEYIEKEYANLTYFELKEFYKGKSKQAIEFLQENHHFGDTENLYLEMKSLLLASPKDKHIPENIDYPTFYNEDLIEKWAEHKCGMDLWYAFGYKYGTYKDSIKLDAVFERHQEKILALANSIDGEEFEDASFNEVFFAKLWEYMAKDVIPRLNQFQGQIVKKLPDFSQFLYLTFLLLVIFGVLLPLSHLLLGFAAFVLILGYSVVLSTVFFIAITFLIFLSGEVSQ
jgi:hypothetical protein